MTSRSPNIGSITIAKPKLRGKQGVAIYINHNAASAERTYKRIMDLMADIEERKRLREQKEQGHVSGRDLGKSTTE